jgi:hypothetical protein
VTLKEAARRSEEFRTRRNEYLSNLHGLETVEDFEHIEERDLYPSNRYYTIKLFYNPARFRTGAEQRKLRGYLADARAKYADRNVELRSLSVASLTFRSMSLFPDTERRFLDQGYVLDAEGRDRKTARRASLMVVSHNIDVLRANAFYWSRMLLKSGSSLLLWAKPPREKERGRLFAVMAPIMGRPTDPDSGKSRDEQIIPLVEHEQMLLGARIVKERTAHIAHITTPSTVVDHGRREFPSLFSDRADLVESQLAFELANSYKIFEGNDAPSTDAGSTTSAAILTWFSQVVTAQRKLCWLLEAKHDWRLALKQLLREEELHKNITGVAELPRKVEEAKTWPELLQSELKGHADDIESSTEQCALAVEHQVSLQHRILAALHGSTIDLDHEDEHEFFDSGSHLIALAYWIGLLKRTGGQTLSRGIACYLRAGWSSIEAAENCLLGQFPKATWDALLRRARDFFPPVIRRPGKLPYFDYRGFKESKPVKIKYEWITEETLNSPPYREAKGSIVLRGAMLCFPLHQVTNWADKAQIIRPSARFHAPAEMMTGAGLEGIRPMSGVAFGSRRGYH